jgi:hypothetical protein
MRQQTSNQPVTIQDGAKLTWHSTFTRCLAPLCITSTKFSNRVIFLGRIMKFACSTPLVEQMCCNSKRYVGTLWKEGLEFWDAFHMMCDIWYFLLYGFRHFKFRGYITRHSQCSTWHCRSRQPEYEDQGIESYFSCTTVVIEDCRLALLFRTRKLIFFNRRSLKWIGMKKKF